MKAGNRAKQRDRKKPMPQPQQRPYKASFVKKSHLGRNVAVLTGVVLLVIIAVYALSQTGAGSSAVPLSISSSAWKTAPLTNAQTGQDFTLGQFSGKIIVLQFMATYCQYCLDEGHQLASVQASLAGDNRASGQVVIVSVDVDPNENVAQLKNYVQQYSFGAPNSSPSWVYAKDTSGQLLQVIAGNVNFGSFISLTHVYFIDRAQTNNFLTMQRSAYQVSNPASDIVAAVDKIL